MCNVREETLGGQVSATAAFTRCKLSSHPSSVLHDVPVVQMFGVVTTQTVDLSRGPSLRSPRILLDFVLFVLSFSFSRHAGIKPTIRHMVVTLFTSHALSSCEKEQETQGRQRRKQWQPCDGL